MRVINKLNSLLDSQFNSSQSPTSFTSLITPALKDPLIRRFRSRRHGFITCIIPSTLHPFCDFRFFSGSLLCVGTLDTYFTSPIVCTCFHVATWCHLGSFMGLGSDQYNCASYHGHWYIVDSTRYTVGANRTDNQDHHFFSEHQTIVPSTYYLRLAPTYSLRPIFYVSFLFLTF